MTRLNILRQFSVDRYKRNPCGDSTGFEHGNTCAKGGHSGTATAEGRRPAKGKPNQERVAPVDIPQVKFRSATPTDFVKARDKSTRAGFLSGHSEVELTEGVKKGGLIFLSEDGGSGYYLSPDKDLQNVFNNGTIKGAGKAALVDAIANGAETLDCYEPFLPSLYHDFGFQTTEIVRWDDQYAPEGWDYQEQGRPDVVFMRYPQDGTRDRSEIRAKFGTYGKWKNPQGKSAAA